MAEAKVGVTGFQENMQALKQNWFFRGFFKNRGYPDSTQLTKHEIAQMPEGPYLQKFVYDAKDLFEKPKTAKLKKEKLLKPVGEFLEKNHFGLVVVAAYTGLTGDKEENLMLTQARAMVIRQYLAEHFRFDDTRVKTKGLGEDEQTEARNASRVEIIVYPKGSEKPPAKNTRLSSN